MPQLKASERRLLILFGTVMLGLFTYFFVFEFLLKEHKAVRVENAGLQRELDDKRRMMSRTVETLPKREWLDLKQPAAPDFIIASERLERLVINSAEREGLQLKNIGTVGEEVRSNYHAILMEVELRGEIAPITRWLASLQDQDKFRAITKCEVSPVQPKEPKELKCVARVEQWYALGSGALAAAGGAGSVVGGTDDLDPAPEENPAAPIPAPPSASTAEEGSAPAAAAPDSRIRPLGQGRTRPILPPGGPNDGRSGSGSAAAQPGAPAEEAVEEIPAEEAVEGAVEEIPAEEAVLEEGVSADDGAVPVEEELPAEGEGVAPDETGAAESAPN